MKILKHSDDNLLLFEDFIFQDKSFFFPGHNNQRYNIWFATKIKTLFVCDKKFLIYTKFSIELEKLKQIGLKFFKRENFVTKTTGFNEAYTISLKTINNCENFHILAIQILLSDFDITNIDFYYDISSFGNNRSTLIFKEKEDFVLFKLYFNDFIHTNINKNNVICNF